jgi:hypothetical protein
MIWMDRDLFNNSYVEAADGTAGRKLANYWLFANQLLAQALAWLV